MVDIGNWPIDSTGIKNRKEGNTGVAKEFVLLLKPIEHIKTDADDSAYNSLRITLNIAMKKITPLVPVHIDSVGISPHRKLCVEEQLGVIRRRSRNKNV